MPMATLTVAQDDMKDVEIGIHKAGEGVYMLTGSGGNMGLSVGDDGAFLIDDQFAPLTEKIKAAIGSVTDRPIRFLVNTHWHGDHTGGNENLGAAGTLIVAHENVRNRMSVEQFVAAFDSRSAPAPEAALPVITFTDQVTFHWNDDVLRVIHVDPAHTDGDSIIYFTEANVVHMGDVYFNGMYPFIDASTGGSMDGMIAAADRALALIRKDTTIIPGHGPISNVRELRDYRGMLVKVRDRVRPKIAAGKSRDEVIAARPTADLDATWGGGFLKADVWVGIVYDSMTK
jgi:glyoxylase-like metal-dependent hydrolase (beta-lactamase superfamily II)